MSRRIAIWLICLAALPIAISGWVWFHYLRYPDMPLSTGQASDVLRIRPPTDAFCQRVAGDQLYQRVILVKLHTGSVPPAITINNEQQPLGWPKTAELLHDIYAVRAMRVAFLQSDPGVNTQYVREMIDILRKAEVSDICMVDPAYPPEIPVYRLVAQ